MGTCCGYVNQKQDREKTVYTGGSNREREIQDVLDKLNEENQNETRLHPQDKMDDQGETSSQRSFQYGSMLQNNIQSMIQNHGTMEQDENEKYKKEPFYGAEALGEYTAIQTQELNLQNIANEEVLPVQAEQIGLEVKEQKKLIATNSKELKELEKKKSDLNIIKQDTLQALNPNQKDILLRRASQQFEQQQSLLKQQQNQLIQQQQLLEKQQMIQQQLQQQLLAQQQQLQQVQQKQVNQQINIVQQPQQQVVVTQPNSNAQAQLAQQNPNDKNSNMQKAQMNLPQLKKAPNSQPAASQLQPNSPLMSARGRKAENDVNSSFDSGSVKSVDKPRSIMKRRNNNDLNSSFNSDADSQKSKAKKKVKFKESAFKKTSKKKKSGY
ncbi:hypothetical protein ABPG72_009202 [Tetrahymena utriculariae]